jgi:hypothetical protein
MIRGLIALLIASVLTFTGLTAPAYAASNHVGGLSLGAKQVSDSHDSFIIMHSSSSSSRDQFVKGVGNGFLGTAGTVIGGAIFCYVIDGAAATVFPPAAALLPYCPVVGAAVGGVGKVVDVAAKAR